MLNQSNSIRRFGGPRNDLQSKDKPISQGEGGFHASMYVGQATGRLNSISTVSQASSSIGLTGSFVIVSHRGSHQSQWTARSSHDNSFGSSPKGSLRLRIVGREIYIGRAGESLEYENPDAGSSLLTKDPDGYEIPRSWSQERSNIQPHSVFQGGSENNIGASKPLQKQPASVFQKNVTARGKSPSSTQGGRPRLPLEPVPKANVIDKLRAFFSKGSVADKFEARYKKQIKRDKENGAYVVPQSRNHKLDYRPVIEKIAEDRRFFVEEKDEEDFLRTANKNAR